MISILTDEQLNKLPTHRLLALFKKVRREYMFPYDIDNKVEIKAHEKFKKYYLKVKDILDKRENI